MLDLSIVAKRLAGRSLRLENKTRASLLCDASGSSVD